MDKNTQKMYDTILESEMLHVEDMLRQKKNFILDPFAGVALCYSDHTGMMKFRRRRKICAEKSRKQSSADGKEFF